MVKIWNNQRITQCLVIILSALLIFPTTISAKKRKKGIRLMVISDKVVKGELLKVKKDSLLILLERRGSMSSVDVDISKIKTIKIIKKSKIGKGFLYGFLIGSTVGVLWGRSQAQCKHDKGLQGFMGGIVFGTVGCLGGGAVGAGLTLSEGRYKEIYNKEKSIGNLNKIINMLNNKAHYPNPIFEKE